jgi:hypothetical protein
MRHNAVARPVRRTFRNANLEHSSEWPTNAVERTGKIQLGGPDLLASLDDFRPSMRGADLQFVKEIFWCNERILGLGSFGRVRHGWRR